MNCLHKIELVLTRRAKAYNSSCSQIVLVYFHSLCRIYLLLKCVPQLKIAKINIKPFILGVQGLSKSTMLIRLKSSSLVVIGSMLMLICNHFHERLANSGKIKIFPGGGSYRSLMPSCAGFLERKNWDLLKISYAACPCLFLLIAAQFAFEMCLVAQNLPKNLQKPVFWCSRSSKVIDFGVNRKPVYYFLLVININLSPISHSFWDMATYWLKIANFSIPLSFSALAGDDPYRIYGKALRILKLESSKQPIV